MGLNHSSLYLLRVNYQTKLLRGNNKELCRRCSGNLHSLSVHMNSISVSPNNLESYKNNFNILTIMAVLTFSPCLKEVLSTKLCLTVKVDFIVLKISIVSALCSYSGGNRPENSWVVHNKC